MRPEEIFAAAKKPLFVVAHQDDELGYAGIIQRLGAKTRFVFMTNGDGVAPAVGAEPTAYAKMRQEESRNALAVLGIPPENIHCLGWSEIEIYSHMADLADTPARRGDALAFFEQVAASVREAVLAQDPDLVFATGFQGGHPEHDLAHLFCALAVRELERRRGQKLPFFHLPEYELTILVPFRFGRWYRGERLYLELTDEEFEKKTRMAYQYPSQEELFRKFERVFRYINIVGKLIGKDWSSRGFWGREQFSPVPEGFDYTRPPRSIDFFNYMFDDFQKRPITFRKCIQPIARHFAAKGSA